MSGVFNLGHVLEFVIDCLNNGPFSEQDLVGDGHERTFHVVPDFCEELYPVHKQLLEQPFAYVPLVPKESPRDVLQERGIPERIMVIDVAGRQHETEQPASLVTDHMQLEAVEPSLGALASL